MFFVVLVISENLIIRQEQAKKRNLGARHHRIIQLRKKSPPHHTVMIREWRVKRSVVHRSTGRYAKEGHWIIQWKTKACRPGWMEPPDDMVKEKYHHQIIRWCRT